MSPAGADSQIVGAVILGAGFGRRFGSDKRLHPLNGRTVAECTIEKYLDVFTHIRVVVRPHDSALEKVLRRFSLQVVIADDAQLGMGHSLAAGFNSLDWRWAFVGLLDMPFISPCTLTNLRDKAERQHSPAILRPTLDGADIQSSGHPVGWHYTFFDELRACRGDAGAKKLVTSHAQRVIDVPCSDIGIVRDIDRPTDLD
jgi:molybdenum cofactor cytidylyltransferase